MNQTIKQPTRGVDCENRDFFAVLLISEAMGMLDSKEAA